MKTKERVYPAIPVATIARLIGDDDFAIMTKYIRHKYGTRKFIIGCSREGPQIILNNPEGKQIGTVAKVLRRAEKAR